MAEPPLIIATFNDYEGLLSALRARAQARRIAVSSDNANDIAGLPDKYVQKLLGPHPPRRLGMVSMGAILGLLGVKLMMVEDEKAMKLYANRTNKRNNNLVHNGGVHFSLSTRFMRKIGIIGGGNSRKYMTRRKARQIGQQAARARWDKPTAAR